MTIKQQLLHLCQDFVQNKIDVLEATIKSSKEALNSETKSSAGDKHETGRAMLQLEMEKAGQQLLEVQKMKNQLQRIDLSVTSERVSLGSLVNTNLGRYFIAISQGQIKVENKSYFVISSQSPIGKLLLGKSVNEVVYFRSQEIKIQEIL